MNCLNWHKTPLEIYVTIKKVVHHIRILAEGSSHLTSFSQTAKAVNQIPQKDKNIVNGIEVGGFQHTANFVLVENPGAVLGASRL